MVLTDEEVEARLASPLNLSNSLVEIRERKKKTAYGSKLGPRVRQLVGNLTHTTNNTQEEIADAFGITQASVSYIKRGLTGIGTTKDEELIESNNKAKSSLIKESNDLSEKSTTAHSKALDLLMNSLESLAPRLTPEKSEGIKAKDLSRIATDMSRIASNLDPKKKDTPDTVNNTQVILYQPTLKTESSYEVIES